MSSGESTYRALCGASHLEAAVRRLTAQELTDVAEYIGGLPPGGGIPSMVWGAVQGELGRARHQRQRAAKRERKGAGR